MPETEVAGQVILNAEQAEDRREWVNRWRSRPQTIAFAITPQPEVIDEDVIYWRNQRFEVHGSNVMEFHAAILAVWWIKNGNAPRDESVTIGPDGHPMPPVEVELLHHGWLNNHAHIHKGDESFAILGTAMLTDARVEHDTTDTGTEYGDLHVWNVLAQFTEIQE